MKTVKPLSKRQKYRLEIQLWAMRHRFGDADRPLRILDLGTEYGLTGESLREAYPSAVISGVEVHTPTFETCVERSVELGTYNALHRNDAVEFMQSTEERWDAIVCAELIEHLEKNVGFELLRLIREKSDFAVITSPIGFASQGELYGNPYQRHVSGWTAEDMHKRKFQTFVLMPGGYTLGVYVYDKTGRLP